MSSEQNKNCRLAITMGDAAGVGPEIIVRGWGEIISKIPCIPIVYGHPEILRRAIKNFQLNCEVQVIDNPFLVEPSQNVIPCFKCGSDHVLKAVPGQISAVAGEAAYHAIINATIHAQTKKVHGIVTMPINKQALNMAGCHYPGHTELIAERCGVDDFAMMLYLGHDQTVKGDAGLAVVHVTLHMAMRDVFTTITHENVLAKAQLAYHFMLKMKGAPPKIGVCSLNPHAGENGLFGREELTIIQPAIRLAQEYDINIDGPFPADTIMIDARDGKYDAIVAMFHDQGHIALKLLGMHRAVNITLGLPIIRTSVAHGTAFDIAWQGVAETGSMIEAMRVATVLASHQG